MLKSSFIQDQPRNDLNVDVLRPVNHPQFYGMVYMLVCWDIVSRNDLELLFLVQDFI